MGKLKLIEAVIQAIATLVSAVKYSIKFIDCILKLRRRSPAT